MDYISTYKILNNIKTSLENLEVSGDFVFVDVKVLMSETSSKDINDAISDSNMPCALIMKEEQNTEKTSTRLSYNRDLPIRILIFTTSYIPKLEDDNIYKLTYDLEYLVMENILNMNEHIEATTQDIYYNDLDKNRFGIEVRFSYKRTVNFVK